MNTDLYDCICHRALHVIRCCSRMYYAYQCKVLSDARFWSKCEWKICVLHSVERMTSVLIHGYRLHGLLLMLIPINPWGTQILTILWSVGTKTFLNTLGFLFSNSKYVKIGRNWYVFVTAWNEFGMGIIKRRFRPSVYLSDRHHTNGQVLNY